jgi:cold shock CspA family protein
MKRMGKLCFWNSQKSFGIIETRTKEGAGYRLERFFLHRQQIRFEPEAGIHEGQLVRFVVREGEPPAGKLQVAGSAEIFDVPVDAVAVSPVAVEAIGVQNEPRK